MAEYRFIEGDLETKMKDDTSKVKKADLFTLEKYSYKTYIPMSNEGMPQSIKKETELTFEFRNYSPAISELFLKNLTGIKDISVSVICNPAYGPDDILSTYDNATIFSGTVAEYKVRCYNSIEKNSEGIVMESGQRTLQVIMKIKTISFL